MYSPKISEALIPDLYWLAKSRGQPMTRIVNEVLARYLASHAVDRPGPASHPASAIACGAEAPRDTTLTCAHGAA